MRLRIALCVLLLACSGAIAQRTATLTPASAAPEPRVALVVGNSAYKESPLANPVNDANDMAAALRDLGFKVILLRDGNTRDMRQAIREWGSELRRARVGLFYFAGHGVQIRGNNYLIPVATPLMSEADVEDLAIDANYAVRTMEESHVEVSIMILDACRNNPFARNFRSTAAGLAQMTAAKGTVIAFATAPGSVAADGRGRNGTYTKNLLENLRQPDTDILKVFQRTRAGVVKETNGKQMPWESTSLVGDFHFRPQAASAPQVALAVQPAPPAASPKAAATSSTDMSLESATFLEDLEAFVSESKAPVSELERQVRAGDPLAAARYCAAGTHERFNLGVSVEAGLAQCRRLSDSGVAAGQFFYARAMMLGRGVMKDQNKAVALYRKSAEQGFPLAMNNLGAAYLDGIGVEKNPAEGIHWLRRAAESGSPIGMTNLGTRYMSGQGIEKNESQGALWIRRAVELGDTNGMVNLGQMYKNGTGVVRDHAQALQWFQRAAERGNAAAMAEVGIAYSLGWGVTKNPQEAARWYRRASDRGDVTGLFNLATMYRQGEGGLSRDHSEALRLYRLAAEKGSTMAMVRLGNMYLAGDGVSRSDDEAVRWIRQASDAGDGDAASELGFMYGTGKGVSRNDEEAVRLYRLAADRGSAYGYLNLGFMYAEARGGLGRDLEQAANWYRKAAASDLADVREQAAKNLKAIGK